MEPFEALSLCAEVAIAITGFSGVVLVFGDRGGPVVGAMERALFRTLFTATIIPIGIVALAFILEAAALPRSTTWRVCSAAHTLAVATTMLFNALATRRVRPEREGAAFAKPGFLPRAGALVLGVALLVLCLQVTNAISLHLFWPLLVAVWWGIAVSLFSFVSLLFHRFSE